jgi:mRNA interferase MazF
LAAMTDRPLRWAVVVMDLDPARGHEQAGIRRAVVVSYEPFHRSGMATVCPVTTRRPKYAGEIPMPEGHAGQTATGLILCHQARTVDLERVTAYKIAGQPQYVTDRAARASVRLALRHHLGLDVPALSDGAAQVSCRSAAMCCRFRTARAMPSIAFASAQAHACGLADHVAIDRI